MADRSERWRLDAGEHRHEVTIQRLPLGRRTQWWVDGEVVAEHRSSRDRVTLEPSEPGGESLGKVRVAFTTFGGARRVVWFRPGERGRLSARTAVGGIDLDPEPGSAAAVREARARRHPRWYASRHVAAGVTKVLVPFVLTYLVVHVAVRVGWPDWSVPVPSWRPPDVVPDVDLPSWQLPGWLVWALERRNYVWPVVLGGFLARHELSRRRSQDAIKAGLRTPPDPATRD
jgi:hypothetical protein